MVFLSLLKPYFKCGPFVFSCFFLLSCGGNSINTDSFKKGQPFQEGIFGSSSVFKSFCEIPRAGVNPATGLAYEDMFGSTLDENNWLRSWSNETYLWYDEITDQNPGLYTETLEYFDILKTEAVTTSGNPKDRFHFTLPTDEWFAFSRSGVTAAYGAEFVSVKDTVPRKLVVAYVEIGSPAHLAGLARGTEVLFIDGVDVVNTTSSNDIGILNAALLPDSIGETHIFVVKGLGENLTRTVNLTSANITSSPVLSSAIIPTASGDVAYLVFNDHIATAEQQLAAVFTQFQLSGVNDLILDLRYNGGGFLAIASQLAYMIAGNQSNGKTFELTRFNDKHPDTNPITGELIEPLPFLNQTVGFSLSAGQALPSLNLNRVFVLTTKRTCSASESLINGLRGIDIDLVQIGSTTCGKPYGFFAEDNCGTTYFTIQTTGVNNKNFGEFSDGFSPSNALVNIGEPVKGCVVLDDFSRALGDSSENMIAEALSYRNTGVCSTSPVMIKPVNQTQKISVENSLLENKLMTHNVYKAL